MKNEVELKYLGIAKEISEKSNCLRRQYGAVIVKNDKFVSMGYNATPCKVKRCIKCAREGVEHGTKYELCRSVHAEQSAIINANSEDMKNAILFLYGTENENNISDIDCCSICKRLIINAGIRKVVMMSKDKIIKSVQVSDWIKGI